MSDSPSPSASSRARGRGKSRGGLGKYLRARGRGRGTGRPAIFSERLVLPGEEPDAEEDEGAAEELRVKYSRRELGTNVDRYKEEEVLLDSDGEEIREPEIDLSSFLEKQRIHLAENPDDLPIVLPSEVHDPEDEVDHALSHISSLGISQPKNLKGKTQIIEWDETLDELRREKEGAEATWDLKSRFKAKSEHLRKPLTHTSARASAPDKSDAPLLPQQAAIQERKGKKIELEEFLDDLLG